MKKSLVAFAVLSAFAGAASAQSSVTVFGVVDLSANSWKNGSNEQKRLDSNQMNSNRLGFRGTEDLGGGMSASFWIEGGMDSSVGLGGNANGGFDFQRRSTVSLSGKFGEVRLGRDYTSPFILNATFDVYGANGMGNSLNLYASAASTMGSGAGTVVRANNMAAYFLPSGLGGVYGSVQFSAAEVGAVDGGAVKAAGNGMTAGVIGYAQGPINVAIGLAQTKTATVNDFKVMNIGGSYNFGVAKVLGLFNQHKYGALKYTTTQLSVSVPVGAGEIKASYVRGDASGSVATQNKDSTLVAAEYIHNLSKRTALYAQIGQVDNSSGTAASPGGAATVGGGLAATAAELAVGGFKSTGYGVGVRHSF
jgi:predicted porin